MVLLQIQTQLSDHTVHSLCKCDNDKIMKTPFRGFHTMFLVSHVVLYISTVCLSSIYSSKDIVHKQDCYKATGEIKDYTFWRKGL